MKTLIIAAVAVAALSPATASASLIYDSTIQLSAQGFGTAPRDLSIQGSGIESGCVGVTANGGIAVKSCMGTDAFFMGNTFVNVGGDEPNPLDDNQKYGVPFESERGISSALDIGILFNATEPAGNAINVLDITLKFYNEGMLIGSIDGQQNFEDSFAGNGVAGFVFVVAPDQQAYVNGLLARGNIQFALESTLSGGTGGPESFRLVDLNRTPGDTVPEPTSLALLGFSLLGAGIARRRRQ